MSLVCHRVTAAVLPFDQLLPEDDVRGVQVGPQTESLEQRDTSGGETDRANLEGKKKHTHRHIELH